MEEVVIKDVMSEYKIILLMCTSILYTTIVIYIMNYHY